MIIDKNKDREYEEKYGKTFEEKQGEESKAVVAVKYIYIHTLPHPRQNIVFSYYYFLFNCSIISLIIHTLNYFYVNML